jgi:hypothetical protein
MEELKSFDKLSEKQSTEVQVKKNVQVEYLFDGAVKPMPGHKVWEINTKTLEVKEAEIIKVNRIDWFEALGMYNGIPKSDIIKKKGHVYISALNPSTALKRYQSGKGSASLAIEAQPISIY